MQAQPSNNISPSTSAKQLLIDEIYAPRTSRASAQVLVMKANQSSSAEEKNNAECHAKLHKSEFLRTLEAYGDCV